MSEPQAEMSKLDDSVFVLNKLKGRVVLRIDGFSEIIKEKQNCHSKIVRIRGLDWTLLARAFFANNGLQFYIGCDGGSRGPNWNCAASVILLCTTGSEEVEMGRENDIKFGAWPDNDWRCEVSI